MYNFIISFSIVASLSALKITLQEGTSLIGVIKTSRNGTSFKAFYKIPYGKPPLGHLRFKPPEKIDLWVGTINATDPMTEDDACIQKSAKHKGQSIGKEDCLILNIFTPLDARPGSKIPVIFYIHGGGMQQNYATQDGPEYLMNHYVILVQPNFRLGMFGMFSTGDSIVSGNMAFKDQILALEWVRENIEYFGGDPNRVTLQGHSSGADSVGLHLYSPFTKGLFKQAIMLSGSAWNWERISNTKTTKNVAREIAQSLNCTKYNDSQQIFSCVSRANIQALVDVASKNKLLFNKSLDLNLIAYIMQPVIEDPESMRPFLLRYPGNSQIQDPKIPLIGGFMAAECAAVAAKYLENDGKIVEEANQHSFTQIPLIGQYDENVYPNCINFVTQSLKTYYLQDEDISTHTAIQFTQLISDVKFAYPIIKSLKNYPGVKYVYHNNYKSNYSSQDKRSTYDKYLGPGHVDDLYLLYNRSSESDASLSSEDIQFGDEMWIRYVNFAYTGNPNMPFAINKSLIGPWKQSEHPDLDYLQLNVNGSMRKGLLIDRSRLFRSLPLLINKNWD